MNDATNVQLSGRILSGKNHLFKRGIAFAIDYGLFLAAAFQYIKYFGTPDTADPSVYHFSLRHAFVLFLAWCCWFPLLEAVFGFTPGKGLFDLKVVTLRGLKADVVQIVKRRLLDPIDFACFMLIPGILAVLLTPNGQRLGDLWGQTVVVHESELPNEDGA